MIEVYYAEDDETIGKSVKEYLEQQNCKVAVFDRIADVKKALIGHLPTIVLLDWNMPDGQGSELCLWIRERWKTLPIVYLTIRGDSHDIVTGFQNGADDYVVKPFGVSELLARIRTTLRRADRLKMSQGAQRDVYQVQDLVVDITKHQVLLAGEQIHFTQNEFKILELLCIHAGKVLTYDFILEHVWGPYGGNNNNQILRVNMANIRRKLKEDPSKPKYIHTELGIGYRMLED